LISRGELYTVVTNKAAGGCKGAIVAIVSGTESDVVIERIPESVRDKVKEITLNMAGSMRKIAKSCFML